MPPSGVRSRAAARRTSSATTSRATPSATRRSSRATTARSPRRPRGCTSRTRSSAASPSAACDVASVTLHVGLGTFQPVTVEDLDEHPMHAERFAVSQPTARRHRARARARRARRRGRHDRRARARERRGPRAPRPRPRRERETRLLIQPGYASAWSTGCSRTSTCRGRPCSRWSCAFAGTRARARRVPARRRASGTASSRTATRCSCARRSRVDAADAEGFAFRVTRPRRRSAPRAC